jgi:hypothetical protein
MEPELVSAQNLSPGDIGLFAWDNSLNTDDLEYAAQGRRATWKQAHLSPGAIAPLIWVPVQSLARLHSGDFRWSFRLENIGERGSAKNSWSEYPRTLASTESIDSCWSRGNAATRDRSACWS